MTDSPYVDPPAEPKRRPRPKAKPEAAPARKKELTPGISLVWGVAGSTMAMVPKPGIQPMGRYMQFSAGYSAKKLSAIIKSHDLLYRWLAPFLAQEDAVGMFEVFGPLAMIYMLDKEPRMGAILAPMLRQAMRPVVLEVAKDQAKAREAMASLTGEEADETADDEIDQILYFIMTGGPPPVEAEAPEPEPALA